MPIPTGWITKMNEQTRKGDCRMQFGDILRELLEEHGVKQSELGDALNISAPTVGNWVRDNRQTDYETLCRIADYFGVTTDYLLDHRQEEHIHTHSEDRLLRLYRSLSPDYQELFLQQGVLLWRHEHPKQAE